MLFSWILISCFLQISILESPVVMRCLIRKNYYLSGKGNVVILGTFPLYTMFPLDNPADLNWKDKEWNLVIQFKVRNYQCILAMLFAIEEINNNPELLPNITLGFEIRNLLNGEKGTLSHLFGALSGPGYSIPNYSCETYSISAAILTGISWAISEIIGTVLKLYKFPQLTFGPFDDTLSEQREFPFLYQMAPKDTSLTLGIVSLIVYFHWNWVGLFIADNDKGAQILADFRSEIEKNGVCIAFVEMTPVNKGLFLTASWENPRQHLESSANVVIIYGDSESILDLIVNAKQRLMTWKVWVLTSKWDSSKFEDYFMLDFLNGALIFSHHNEEIPKFSDFLLKLNPFKYPEDRFLNVFWYTKFNCSFLINDCKIVDNCLPNASLGFLPGNSFDLITSEESNYVYNAVYAVAHSLHEMMLNQVQFQTHGGQKEVAFFPWQLHPFLKNTQFINNAGDHVVLDWKRRFHTEYDIHNFWNFPMGLRLNVKVGNFSPNAPDGHKLSLSSHKIQWFTGLTEIPQSICSESCHPGFRKTHREGETACCFDCTQCPENEISNQTDVDQCLKCPETHFANTKKTHCLQKTVTFLAYDDPMGKTLSVMSLGFSSLTAVVLGVFLKHRDTPIVKANNRDLTYILLITLALCFLCPLLYIGRPSTVTCVLQQNIFGLLFTVALSTVLAKTVTVVMAFKITAPGRMGRWLLISRTPNFIIPICTLLQVVLCGIWLASSPPFIDKDAHSEHGHIIIMCNKGSTVAFYCILGYLGILALGSYLMAFLSRNLPDTFNEAKFLAFSMLVFCSVWVTFLPVYHSTKGKVMVAMEVVSILASSISLLGIIFGPKGYIILLRSERNSLHHIRGKTYAKKKSFKT